MSGIAKRYGFRTTHDFYKAYASAKNAYASYQNELTKWEETYGIKVENDTLHDRMQRYQKIAEQQPLHSKSRGAR